MTYVSFCSYESDLACPDTGLLLGENEIVS